MQNFRIERRLPFGFMGDWGKVYKKHEVDERQVTGDSIIHRSGQAYIDIGMDVQFRRADDATEEIKQAIKGAMAKASYIIAKTTDAYWDNRAKEYECIVAPEDIVCVFGKDWLAKTIVTKTQYLPAPIKFFYIGLESLKEKENGQNYLNIQ